MSADGAEALAIAHWGSLEAEREKGCLGILNSLPRPAVGDANAGKPSPVLLLESERDPEWMKSVGKDFYEALCERPEQFVVRKIEAKGHNHLSPVWCLGTGQGEQWAEEVVGWTQEASDSSS